MVAKGNMYGQQEWRGLEKELLVLNGMKAAFINQSAVPARKFVAMRRLWQMWADKPAFKPLSSML